MSPTHGSLTKAGKSRNLMRAANLIIFREVTTTNKKGISITHKYKGKKSLSPRVRNRRNYEKRFLNK